MIIKGKEIPLRFDGHKMYINIRALSEDEIDKLEIYELTSPEAFTPETNYFSSEYEINQR